MPEISNVSTQRIHEFFKHEDAMSQAICQELEIPMQRDEFGLMAGDTSAFRTRFMNAMNTGDTSTLERNIASMKKFNAQYATITPPPELAHYHREAMAVAGKTINAFERYKTSISEIHRNGGWLKMPKLGKLGLQMVSEAGGLEAEDKRMRQMKKSLMDQYGYVS